MVWNNPEIGQTVDNWLDQVVVQIFEEHSVLKVISHLTENRTKRKTFFFDFLLTYSKTSYKKLISSRHGLTY